MTWSQAARFLLAGLLILAIGVAVFVIREGERITVSTPPGSVVAAPSPASAGPALPAEHLVAG
jgi:hypothetical protein